MLVSIESRCQLYEDFINLAYFVLEILHKTFLNKQRLNVQFANITAQLLFY